MGYPMNKQAQKRRHLVDYRSGLEESVAEQIQDTGQQVNYETVKIGYRIPESSHVYTPDFVLSNGIIVETKGYMSASDRKKHLLVKAQHPELDIRFVFTRANTRLSKASSTTYATWCKKNGFQFAVGRIPETWFTEKGVI